MDTTEAVLLLPRAWIQALGLALRHDGIELLFRSFDSSLLLGDIPLDIAGLHLFFRDAAGLLGYGVDRGAGAILDLAGAACGNEDVPVVAIETCHQLHGAAPFTAGGSVCSLKESKIDWTRCMALCRLQRSAASSIA